MDVAYTTPMENHNPMEMHATIAAWDGDRVTLEYAQHLGIPFSCFGDTQYFVEGIKAITDLTPTAPMPPVAIPPAGSAGGAAAGSATPPSNAPATAPRP